MTRLGGVGVVVLLCARVAVAGTVNLDNGLGNVQYTVDVDVDDFGSYGREVSPNADDNFWPFGVTKAENQTFLSSTFLFITAPFSGAVCLSSHQLVYNKVEPPNGGDGIKGPATLTRTVTSDIVKTGTTAHSEFEIAESASGLLLKFKLDQQLAANMPTSTSTLAQDYTITNAGTAAATLVFHSFWDMDLYFGDQLFDSDVVGAGPGLCYVYMHDPGSTSQGGSLTDGGSTVTTRYYYAGKQGYSPDGGPAYESSDSTTRPEWAALQMPVGWRNNIAYRGYNTVGEASEIADGIIGMEWHFTIAAGATETIRMRRIYGTISVPCNVSTSCGNSMVDSGETCDTGVDTMTCNGATCSAPSCGDNYINAAAGEECESIGGMDTNDCNAGTCLHPACGDGYVNAAAGEACDDGEDTANCNLANCQPPMCGDGIVNLAAGEDCEGGELCDTTCQYTFSLGGGCGGCASGGDGAPWLIVIALLARRGRRRTRALPRGSGCSAR